MLLKDYFKQHKGAGVLCTADADGVVNAAIYAKPHVTDDGRVAFLMRERKSWQNIGENPSAHYLFMEEGAPYNGIRILLQKIGEEHDEQLMAEMTRGWITAKEDASLGPKHLVFFEIEKVRVLVGDTEPDLSWNLQ